MSAGSIGSTGGASVCLRRLRRNRPCAEDGHRGGEAERGFVRGRGFGKLADEDAELVDFGGMGVDDLARAFVAGSGGRLHRLQPPRDLGDLAGDVGVAAREVGDMAADVVTVDDAAGGGVVDGKRAEDG